MVVASSRRPRSPPHVGSASVSSRDPSRARVSPRRPRDPNRLGLRLAHVGPGLGLAHISSRDPSRARVSPVVLGLANVGLGLAHEGPEARVG